MLALVTWAVAWLLVAAIATTLLIAIAPLRLRGSLRSEPDLTVQVKVAVLDGTLPYVTIMDGTRKRTKKPKRKRNKASHRLGRAKDMAGNFPALINRLLRRIHIEDVSGRLEFGFDDPAETGQVFGLLCPVIYGMPPLGRINMSIRPIFSRPVFEGNIDVLLKFTPITLLGPIARFAWRSFRKG